MSLSSMVSSSDASFKLSQKLVSSLAEKFGFKFEDGWSSVSSRTVAQVQKRIRRDKKNGSPLSKVKHQRTAYSFFTSVQRPIELLAHPEADFGQLSKYVSAGWKVLTPEQQLVYKNMEIADKARYQTDRDAALAAMPAVVDSAVVASVDAAATMPAAETVAKESKPKKVAKPKATPSEASATPSVVAASSEAPAPATVAKPKVKSAKASPAVAPVAAPVAAAPAVAAAAPVAAPVAAVPAVAVAAPAVAPVADVKSAGKKSQSSAAVPAAVDSVKASVKKTDKK